MASILILGASGMLGHTLFARLYHSGRHNVKATVRSKAELSGCVSPPMSQALTGNVDAESFDSIVKVLGDFKPDCVINCIGIIKQLAASAEHIPALSINSLFPHRLALLCKAIGARLIHISSDCVFNGSQGNYQETDPSDATDLYGRTKFLGEVSTYSHCVTLRTSIIGHELASNYGLLEWFLSQQNQVKGFTETIFSGFPTVELARIIMDYVIPDRSLNGLYHASSEAISKYDLLKIIAKYYESTTTIVPCADFVVDRSLDSSRFREATGYVAPLWDDLVKQMHTDFLAAPHYRNRHCHDNACI